MMLELRFKQVAFQYLANHMRIAGALAKDYPMLQASPTAVKFDVDENAALVLDGGRIALSLTLKAAVTSRCIEIASRAIREWKTGAGDLPPLQRAGFRVQSAQATEMSRRELIDVYSDAIFATEFRARLEPNHDFALTIEELEGVDGRRLNLGMMGYEELLGKWQLPGDQVEEAPSFLTTDFDYGNSKVSASVSDVELFIKKSWADISSRNADLTKIAGI